MAEQAEQMEEQIEQPSGLSLLAKEKFGNQYFPKEEPKAPEEPVTEETPVEAPEEFDTEREDFDGEETGEPEEEAPIRSLTELTESLRSLDLDIDGEFIDQLTVPLKVNGKDVEIPISELKANAQMKEAAQQFLDEAKEKRNQAAKEIEEKNNYLLQQYNTTSQLIQHAEQMLSADIQSINWEELKAEDPAQYAIKREEMRDRMSQLQNLKQQAGQSVQQWRQQQEQERQTMMAEHLQYEHQELLKKLPEWKDDDVADQEKNAIVDYLTKDLGFKTEELQDASDHRLILLARKAMLYDQKGDKNKITEKKLKKIPKIMKPGGAQTEGQVSKKEVDKLRSRLRQSKGKDALATGMALLKAKRSK